MLVLARIAPQKNTKRFIQALKGVKDDGFRLHIDWYGQHFEPYHTECLNMMEEQGVSDMLHIHPAASQVEKLYCNYDALCLPSIFEGFPNVVGEAMSCALPVVCGDVCDNRLIVGEENGNLLFDPYDIADMKEKIEQFCQLDSRQLRAIGEANRERAVQLFAPGKFESEYLKLLQP
jgi:glycosyltransferase involved in cell wall biosynthesis